MTIFKFYTFKFIPCEDTAPLFAPATPAQHADMPAVLGSLLHQGSNIELSVPKDIHASEWEKFRCQVLRHEDGVALLALEANRRKHTTIDMKDVVHDHHPFCLIIVDNRPGRQRIGIERNSAFGPNTDKVADILRTALSYKIHDCRHKIDIERLAKKNTGLWNVVDEIVGTFDDRVTQIRLDYMGDRRSCNNANNMLALMQLLARKSDSDALFELNARSQSGVRIDDIRNDVQRIAEICLNQPEYNLAVRFRNFGVYRYGADLVAQFGMEQNVVEDFATGKTIINFETGQPGYELTLWLDRLDILMYNDYNNEPIQPRRAQRRRR